MRKLFFVAFVATCANVFAWESYENLEWEISGTVLTIRGTGEMKSLSLERAYPWTPKKEITEIVIENGVTSVGNYAFYGFENVVKISLPEGLLKIGDLAFYHTLSSAYQECELVIPETVTSVGREAFKACKSLRKITMPMNCDYSVTMERINPQTGLAADEFGPAVSQPVCTVFSETTIKEIVLTGEGAMKSYPNPRIQPWFEPRNGNQSCEKLVLSEGITSIGQQAFYDMQNLKEILLPESLKEIQGSAFFRNPALEAVVFPPNLETIADNAFTQCGSLKEITFTGENPPTFDSGANKNPFSGISQNVVVSVPESAVENYKEIEAFKNKPVVVTGLGEVSGAEISVFPNPASERIFVKNLPLGAEVKLLGLGGKVLISTLENSLEIESLPVGVYILKIENKKFKILKK